MPAAMSSYGVRGMLEAVSAGLVNVASIMTFSGATSCADEGKAMLTVHDVIPRGSWSARAADHITLDHDARYRHRCYYNADGGTAFLLDLPSVKVLNHGDALQLSDGRLIEVVAAPEALVEVTADSPAAMVRLAWHIGNRHLPAELMPHAIRLRDDHVISAMLEGMGATVVRIDAPFTSEDDTYPRDQRHQHAG